MRHEKPLAATALIPIQDQPIHLSLKECIFVSVYGNSMATGPSMGVYYDDRTLTLQELAQLVDKAKGTFKVDAFSCKLIGSEKLIHLMKDLLASYPFLKIQKEVVREGTFEVIFHPREGRVRLSIEQPNPVPSVSRAHQRKFKVLVVDDSASIRKILSQILSSDPEIEVVGAVERPSLVEQWIQDTHPDVITLDIYMPEMDGVTLLKQIMGRHKIPTIMISSLSLEESPLVVEALESGAVDYVQKPTLAEIATMRNLIIEKVKGAALAKVSSGSRDASSLQIKQLGQPNLETIVAIGSSTGGVEALKEILTRLSSPIPPILIAQHLPAVFSKAFANRINNLCPFEVKEAEDGDQILPNRVLIAPGGLQMRVKRTRSELRVVVEEDHGTEHRHKPSVDVLFNSVASEIGKKAIGIILTGMGSDGAQGLLKMRNTGARTIGQDEKSCVVYGMPQAAAKAGGVEHVASLLDIPSKLIELLSKK